MREILTSHRVRIAFWVAIVLTAIPAFLLFTKFTWADTTVNVLFVLDTSSSMAGYLGSERRIEAAKRVTSSVAQGLPVNSRVGLWTLGVTGEQGCSRIDTRFILAPASLAKKRAVTTVVEAISSAGGTPLALALDRIRTAFPVSENEVNVAILIGDGVDTCGQDPCTKARELALGKIKTMILALDLSADYSAEAQYKCIVEPTEGIYTRDVIELQSKIDSLVDRSRDLQLVALVFLALTTTGLLALQGIAQYTKY